MSEKNIQELIFVCECQGRPGPLKNLATMVKTKMMILLKGCTLCVLTNTLTGEKQDWKSCKDELGVPVRAVHPDELTPQMSEVAKGHFPCILARANGTYYLVLTREVIERCRGSVADLKGRLLYHASAQGLSFKIAGTSFPEPASVS